VVTSKEGRDFWNEDNREEFYTRLLGFLDTHIGAGAVPTK
jgi:hypothetical protein